MFKKRAPDGEEKHQVFGTHPGDLGVIFIAAMITLTFLAILLSPSPFPKLEEMEAKQEKADAQARVQAVKDARRQEINKAVASGEVSVGISSPSKP